MIRSLVHKELREHLPALIFLFVMAGIGCPLLYLIVQAYDLGSVLETLRWFLIVFVSLASAILSHRLVAHEYRSKTQLFLEALPISRARMVLVKYLFGLTLLMGLVGAASGGLFLLGLRGESLSPRFVGILAVRSVGFTLSIYTVLFASGFLGRYRWAILVVVTFGLAFLNSRTQFELNRFGPLALIDDRFAYERDEWPVRPLIVTGVIFAVSLLLTAALALLREGSAAALLAERMSHREKLFVSILVIGFVFALTMYDKKTYRKPFDLLSAATEQRDGVTVKVTTLGVDPTISEELAKLIAAELLELRLYLHLPDLPPVYIVSRRDLDADRVEWRSLPESEGVLGRANFSASTFDNRRFVAALLPQLFSVASRGRLGVEPKRWVLDGFGSQWAYRDRTKTFNGNGAGVLEQKSPDPVLALRAAYGSREFQPETDRSAWLRFRERVGGDIADAVAWAGLESILQSQGAEKHQRLLQAVLRLDVPTDLRGGIYEWQNPVPVVLQREANLSGTELDAVWNNHLAKICLEREEDLARLPRIEGDLHIKPVSGGTAQVTFETRIEPYRGRSRSGPSKTESDFDYENARYSVIFARLKRFDVEVPREDWQREEFVFGVNSGGVLAETFPRGTRLMTTLALHIDELQCEVVSGWQRREVP